MGLAALSLTEEYGLSVFPVRARCKQPPLTENGYLDASRHPEQIADWWNRFPDANIAAVPGSIDCVVIDSDGPEGELLARQLGILDIPTCQTMSARGCHRWFRLPAGMRVNNIARKELDVRSSAGYVMVPESVHPTGALYEWRGSLAGVADAPDALVEWVRVGGRTSSDTLSLSKDNGEIRRPAAPVATLDEINQRKVLKYAEKVGYGLSDGRKTGAFRFAAFMLHDLRLPGYMVEAFLATWNSTHVPPLPFGLLQGICRDAARYGGKAA